MTPSVAVRLAELDIQLLAEAKSYCLFSRGELVAMANRDGSGEFVSLGSSGLLTPDGGVAYMVWQDGQPLLTSHGGRQSPATPEQVETIRGFSADLKAALGLNE